MRHLEIAAGVPFDLSLMTKATAVLANRGAGKSYAAMVIAEELLAAKQQVIIIDPVGVYWGLKSAAADMDKGGYAIPVFGGDHGDVALSPDAGTLLAKAVVEHRFSAIFDTSELTHSDGIRFVGDFLHELYRLKSSDRQSCYVIIDEADMFAPQGATSGTGPKCLSAMQHLVRRGRSRGLGCALITQRPQAIAKDVLTQCEVLIALRMTHPRDIGAIEEWVNMQATAAEGKEVVASLPSLPTGEAWFWAPSLKVFRRSKVRLKETFDSSATPEPGEMAAIPKHMAAVDLAKLGAQVASTLEEKKANDPAALKARIRELEARKPTPAADADAEDARVINMLRGENRWLREQVLKAGNGIERMQASLDERLAGALRVMLQSVQDANRIGNETIASLRQIPTTPTIHTTHVDSKTRAATPLAPPRAATDGLNGPKQKILNAVATFKQANLPARTQHIASYCGTTMRARGFEENLRQLRQEGMVTISGGILDANGYGHPGDIGDGMEALEAVLSGPQMSMLKQVRTSVRMTAEDLAEILGTTVRARGFEENLRRLRQDELLIGGKDELLRVAEWLR